MKGNFPRAVVVDNNVHHHYAVWVHRAEDRVMAMCVDCADVVEIPLRMLEQIKLLLRQDDDVQVLAWVEDNGD